MASFAVTTVNDCIFRQNYWFPYLPQVRPLVWIAVTIGNSIPSLRIFIIWKVAGWQQYTRRPPRMRMQNGPPFIINLSSPGGGLQGEVFQKFSDIYTPTPKTAPDQGMINRYLPSWETPRRWRARACPSDPRLGGGGCYHRQFNTKPSYFHHLEGCRVAAVHEEASPNENAKRTAIHHQPLVPRGRLARGSVPKILWYIYAHP